jgi:hypothetical protein
MLNDGRLNTRKGYAKGEQAPDGRIFGTGGDAGVTIAEEKKWLDRKSKSG